MMLEPKPRPEELACVPIDYVNGTYYASDRHVGLRWKVKPVTRVFNTNPTTGNMIVGILWEAVGRPLYRWREQGFKDGQWIN